MGIKHFVNERMRTHVWDGLFGVPEGHPARPHFRPAAFWPYDIRNAAYGDPTKPGRFGKECIVVTPQIDGDPNAIGKKRKDWEKAVVMISRDPSLQTLSDEYPEAEPFVFANLTRLRTPEEKARRRPGEQAEWEIAMIGGLGTRAALGYFQETSSGEYEGKKWLAHAMRLGPGAVRMGFGLELPNGDIVTPSQRLAMPYMTHVVDLAEIGDPAGDFPHINIS